jgi:hypothetical protein
MTKSKLYGNSQESINARKKMKILEASRRSKLKRKLSKLLLEEGLKESPKLQVEKRKEFIKKPNPFQRAENEINELKDKKTKEKLLKIQEINEKKLQNDIGKEKVFYFLN